MRVKGVTELMITAGGKNGTTAFLLIALPLTNLIAFSITSSIFQLLSQKFIRKGVQILLCSMHLLKASHFQ